MMDPFQHPRGLVNLPRELHYMILAYLSADQTSLSHLARTCHLFYAITPPHLYQTVILREDQCQSFAAAVDNVHARADYVKHLTIHCHYLMANNPAYNPLLAASLPPTLGRLIRLPGLETLQIVGASIGTLQCYTDNHRRSTTLKALALHSCDLSPDALREILSIPKALRRLVFKGGRPGMLYDRTRPNHVNANYQAYVDAIEQQAGSLTGLDIDFFFINPLLNPALDLRRLSAVEALRIRVGILQGNRGVREVCLPLDKNLLPRSVKHLTIWETDWTTYEKMHFLYVTVLSQWFTAGSLPHLKSLRFEGYLNGPSAFIQNPGRFFGGKVDIFRWCWEGKIVPCPIGCGCGGHYRGFCFCDTQS